MNTKLSVVLSAILAVALVAGTSLAAGNGPFLRETDEHPAIGNNYPAVSDVARDLTSPTMSKSEPILRETDEHLALGYGYPALDFNEHYGVAPAWTNTEMGKAEMILRETDERPALGYGNPK